MEEHHATPDYNPEAERGVIEAILADESGEIFDLIFELIKNPAYFSNSNFRDIYKTVFDLYVAGSPLDYTHIFTSLQSHILPDGRSMLDKLGGPEGINQYIFRNGFVNYGAAVSAAKMVADSYFKRIAMASLQKSIQAVAGANGNLKTIVRKEVVNRGKDLENFLSEADGAEDAWDQQLLSFDKIMAPLPDRQYLVNGLLTLPSLSIFYGHPGSLKTMVLLDMAFCVAAGKPWLLPLPGKVISPFTTTPSPVLWVDQDSGEDEVRRRIQAIAHGQQIPPETEIHFHLASFVIPPFHADDPDSVSRLIEKAKKHQAKLIVIDCLNAIAGEADENSPEMAHVMHGLRQLAERAVAAVVVIHHCPIGEVRLRGHSSINGAIDLGLAITRASPDAVDIGFWASKTRKHPVKPFWGYFAYESEGDDLKEAKFIGTGKPAPKLEDMKSEDQAIYYIDLIQPQSLNQKEIIEAVKAECSTLGQNSIRKALKIMVEEGDLVETTGKANAKVYSIAY